MRATSSFITTIAAALLTGWILLADAGWRAPLAQSARTDLALVLAIDCSYSVSQAEFQLQVQGTARSFAHPKIIEAILSGRHKSIQVAVIQWSQENSQILTVPWTRVASLDDAIALGARIATQQRQTVEGATSISGAISASLELLAGLPMPADRHVIDISGDGINNLGERVDDTRDRAISYGVTINGLTILNETPWLHHYFRNHVIGGPGAFIEISNDYGAYGAAIRKKLLREIRGNFVS